MSRRAPAPDAPEGGLVVDKPSGITSHDVVAVVRRAFGQPRVGHTGTLDPLATGVLPLLLGRATRLAQFLGADEKTYEATIRFGFATSTYDAEGTPVGPVRDAQVDEMALAAALDGFRGEMQQVPPVVSAKRVGGHRSYDLARADVALALSPVRVHVHALDLLSCAGSEARLRVSCSAGFYVRSLAHDLGQRLGPGAHLAALRRTGSGSFTLDHAVTLDTLTVDPEGARSRVQPMADLLPALPAFIVTEEGAARLKHGRELEPGHLEPGRPATGVRVRILDRSGDLLAVADRRGGVLHPVVVLM